MQSGKAPMNTPSSRSNWSSILNAVLLGLGPATLMADVDRTVLPVPPPPFKGRIGASYEESTAEPAEPFSAPRGAPNILVVLLDDAGYGQSGTFGGLIPTPTLDRLAAGGLKYTQFHVTAMCSPTRAALLTGRNHHSVGMGVISNWSNDFPGYTSSIPRSAAFISEILRQNGYATAAIGKWHLIPDRETTLAGPFDHWPTHQGFDYYYGFIGAETDQWHPEITEGTRPMEMAVPPGRERDYTLNENLADKAIAWIRSEKSVAPDRPFFMYYAPGATHAPLQAPREWIDRFRGRFDMGWDRYRELVLERQKRLGVVPLDTRLTARPPEIPAWDSLPEDQRKVAARLMEVFAGFMAQSDHEIGRVVDAIRQVRASENTLVIFIAGDNGASLEGGVAGSTNLMALVNGVGESTADMMRLLDDLGGPDTTPFYPAGWAWAGNTPFQWGKRIASHLGGTRDPMVICWPEHITGAGGIRRQFHHVIDLFPTILEAARIPAPVRVNGVAQMPVEGVSLAYTFDNPAAAGHRTTQYFELLGNRAIYHDGWIAAARSGLIPWAYGQRIAFKPQPWELYNLAADYSEADDVAAGHPDRLQALQALFREEAEKFQVFPLDPRVGGRQHRNSAPPGGMASYTFYPGSGHLYDAMAPSTENRSHTITAHVGIPAGGADGVLLADGGAMCGFALFIKDGKPAYTYNYFRREITTIADSLPLPPGQATIQVRFKYDGGGLGKGATAGLYVNGRRAAEARIPRTVPAAFSFEETFDIGEDSSTPVGDYRSPFPFTGILQRVELQYDPPDLTAADREVLGQTLQMGLAIEE